MSPTARSDAPLWDSRTAGEPLRAGDGYLLLMLAEACGWHVRVEGIERGVSVTLEHPVYGECSVEGPDVKAVAGDVVEWAFLRARLGAILTTIAKLHRCSPAAGDD